MNAQLTTTYLFVMAISSVVMSILVFMRALDLQRTGDYPSATVRFGFGVFLAAVAFHFTYWFPRWLLMAHDEPILSQWFVSNSSILVWTGAIGTIGVAISCSAALWPALRWQGIILSVSGVLVVWSGGFIL